MINLFKYNRNDLQGFAFTSLMKVYEIGTAFRAVFTASDIAVFTIIDCVGVLLNTITPSIWKNVIITDDMTERTLKGSG